MSDPYLDTIKASLPTSDELVAAAAQFLIEGKDDESAHAILLCHVEGIDVGSPSFSGDRTVYSLCVRLRGPRAVYDAIHHRPCDPLGMTLKEEWPEAVGDRLRDAIRAALPHDTYLENVSVRIGIPSLGPEWREEFGALAGRRDITNQAVGAGNEFAWQGFRFRSPAEIRIAEALDRAGVLFFPLPKGRLNHARQRVNREPDFLVCYDGKWGILEVDGRVGHAGRAADDEQRDRDFHQHGIKVIHRYTGGRCIDMPDRVVADFLGLLDKNG